MGVIMDSKFKTFCFDPPHPSPLPQGEREFPDGTSLDKSPGKVKKAVDFRGYYVESFGGNGVPLARRAKTSAVVIFPFSSISNRRK
jgi:hypothetical protein